LIDRCTSIDADERPSASAVAERANALRSRRTESTGRRELAEWLTSLRDSSPTRDAFNELLSAYLVQQEPGSHVYSITRSSEEMAAVVETKQLGAKGEEPSPDESEGPTGTERLEGRLASEPPPGGAEKSSDAKHGGSRALLVAAGVVLVGAAVLLGLWTIRGDEGPDTLPDAPIASNNPSVKLAPSSSARDGAVEAASRTEGDGAPAVLPSDGGVESSDADAAPGPTKDPPRRHRKRPREPVERPTTSKTPGDGSAVQPEEPATAASTAWLRVGGQKLRRAAIEIDGRPIGHAPLERSMKIGSYRLVARDAESREVLLETRITLSGHHRRTSPLRVIR